MMTDLGCQIKALGWPRNVSEGESDVIKAVQWECSRELLGRRRKIRDSRRGLPDRY